MLNTDFAHLADIAVPTFGVYRFGSSFDRGIGNIPGYYASKSFTGEDASMRQKWRSLVFHGIGTIVVNVFIDNVCVLRGQEVTMTEIPTQQRVINLPRGRSTGYAIRYEAVIPTGHVRFCEIFYEPIGSDVN